MNLTIAIAVAICFQVVRLGLDFEGLWRTPRPYLESCASGMACVAPLVYLRFEVLMHPASAVASSLLFLAAARPPVRVRWSLRRR
ncbi:MAG: hypothetical protein R3B68_13970 [Phycisphaerales bacterium]